MTKTIGEKILKKIKKGKIKMKPKSYFILKTILFVAGIVFAFLLTIFLASFIIFLLRASGVFNFPALGFRGLGMFFASLPWLLMLFVILFVIILEFLARKFSVVYQRPLVYSILGIVIIILLLGIFIARTPMHSKLFQGVQEGKFSVFGPLYKGRHIKSLDNVYFGKVLNLADNGFEIETKEGEIFSIVISSETRPFQSIKYIKEEDTVIVIGDKDNSTIKAFGVHKITDEDTIRFYRRKPMRDFRR